MLKSVVTEQARFCEYVYNRQISQVLIFKKTSSSSFIQRLNLILGPNTLGAFKLCHHYQFYLLKLYSSESRLGKEMVSVSSILQCFCLILIPTGLKGKNGNVYGLGQRFPNSGWHCSQI